MKSGGFSKRNSSLKSYTPLKKGVGLKRGKSRMKKATNPDLIEADSKFSKAIITRDKKCLNCGWTSMLSCSHFFGRSNYATRFDPDNSICLCIPCHEEWESKKDGIYKDFMIAILGQDRFDRLEKKSKIRIRPAYAITDALIFMDSMLPTNEIQY